VERRESTLQIDAVTRRNLEIDSSISGREDATLIALLDSTVTAMGARALRRQLNRPVNDHEELRARLAILVELVECGRYALLRDALRPIGDVERILARVALRSARPRDLTGLRLALAALPTLRAFLATLSSPRSTAIAAAVSGHDAEVALLQRAIAEEPSAMIRDGDVIAVGYDTELDELRRISTHTDAFLLEL